MHRDPKAKPGKEVSCFLDCVWRYVVAFGIDMRRAPVFHGGWGWDEYESLVENSRSEISIIPILLLVLEVK